ncbi:hypothetical protein ACUY1T_21785 [Billgrantia sp. Q4P2]|uniref:hypothetical protein n=1 Tax=Billgrantia sp. Q4P2 TaxID=3463857 RepID=UPI0040565E3E
MNKFAWTWSAFFKRNVKFFAVCLAAFLFFWNSVAILEWLYTLFGGELRGYGPAHQRWHRVWAMGVAGAFVFGFLVDAFNAWYHRKPPEEAERLKKRQEERQGEKTYEAIDSTMCASFVESTATGEIVHRAELSKKEQGYALRLS